MKVELTDNIAAVIRECNSHLWSLEGNEQITDDQRWQFCKNLCPLSGACMEVFTGDNSANN